MAGTAALLQVGDEPREGFFFRERAILDRLVDARQFGHRDAAGAQVHMADLGIAHLSLGQPDEGFRGVDQSLRAGGDQPVIVRRARIEDGVVARIGSETPSVENAKDSRARRLGRSSRHYEALEDAFCRGPVRSIGSRRTELNLFGQFRSRGSTLGFWSGISIAQNTNSPRGSPSIVMS